MINVVNQTTLKGSDNVNVAIGEKVVVVSKRDKTEIQDTRSVVEGTLISFVPARRRSITEAEMTGQTKYVAKRAVDDKGYAMYNNHLTEQPNTVEHITIRKSDGNYISVRGFRIISLTKKDS